VDIKRISPELQSQLLKQTQDKKANEGEFKEMMNSFLTDVNDLSLNVDKKIEQYAAGNIKDIHHVMIAMEEASVAFKLMMEVRNKLLKAYQELIKMPV
jgi:flagellar hook-basal body complex protein FliE